MSASGEPVPPTVVKIGGSLLTDKAREETFDAAQARRLSRELARFGAPVALLHGTGSFGKPAARRHGYMDGFLPAERAAVVSQVDALLDELRAKVLRALRAEGVPACGLSGAGLFVTRDGELARCDAEPVRRLLERGLTAVISGALVADEARGFAVCSSDAMAARLAVLLGAGRLLFATDAPGVMRREGGEAVLVPRLFAGQPQVGMEPSGDDVSGAMGGKVEAGFEAARAGVRPLILDGRIPDRLLRALQGEDVPGTRLLAGRPGSAEAGECAA